MVLPLGPLGSFHRKVEKMKQRIALVHTPVPDAPTLYGRHAAVEKQVLATKEGEVNLVDKGKAYYKGVIALVGALLVGVTQLSGVVPTEAEPWITVAISTLTTLGVILRANEVWVDDL